MEVKSAPEKNLMPSMNQKIASLERRLAETEQALWLSQQNLVRAQAVSHTGSWWLDVRQDALLWSEETYRIFGIDSGTPLTYEDFLAAVHPEDRAFVDESWTAAMQGEPYDIEHRILVGDQVKWVNERAELEFDEQGVLLGGFGTVQDITDRKRHEQILSESEARFRLMGETLPYGVWLCDPQGRAIYTSQSFLDLLEMTEAEMQGFGWTCRLSPDEAGPMMERWLHCVRTGEDWDEEYHVLGPEGKYHTVLTRGKPVRDEHGQITCWVGINLDIDERKRAEETLRKLSRAVEQSPASIVITDTNGRIEYVNPKFTQLTGYSLEEAVGQTPRVLKSGLTPDEVYQDLWTSIRAGREWQGEFCNRTKYGELYYENASISPIKNERGAVTHYVAVKEDITGRKLAEKTLQDRSRRLAFLSDAAGELLCGSDPTALVETICDRLGDLVNIDLYLHFLVSAGESRLHLAASSILSAEDRARIEEPEFGEAIWGRVVLTGKTMIAEDIQNSPDERVAHLRSLGISAYACHPLANQGRLIGTLSFGSRKVARFDTETLSLFQAVCDLVAVAIDRRRAELALEAYAGQLESSNRDLQEFAFVASHDLQEPLRKINSFGHLLLTRSANLDEAQRGYLERMQDAAIRMSKMVDDLLELARVSTQGRPFLPVDLSAVAAELLSDLEMQMRRTGGGVELGELPVIEADPVQMHQLLQNLISNALKYHRPWAPPVVRIYSRQHGSGRVQILVEDNGIGFEERYLENIFQPFRRLVGRGEYEGTGMGLAICKKIAERHGGEITARSIPGQGSTFILTMPVKASLGADRQ